MYCNMKFTHNIDTLLLGAVHHKFFPEYSFMAKGTIISRGIQMFEESGKEFIPHTTEPAVCSARVNLTAHAVDFINSTADRYHISKAAVIESVLTSILNQDVSVQNQPLQEILQLMSWNVDWFRNDERSGKEWEYLEADNNEIAFDGIVKIVKDFLDKERSVCFLQEVPYCIKEANGQWRTAHMWEKLMESFPKNAYKIFEGNPNAHVLHQSIAIARNQVNCKALKLPHPSNRIVGVELGCTKLLGVHMPTLSHNETAKSQAAKLELWDELISFVQESAQPVCIAGDFNAYIGCNVLQINQKFLKLLKYAGEITPHVATFKGGTHIDHILTKKLPITYYSGRVEADFEYSDHKYIAVSLKY